MTFYLFLLAVFGVALATTLGIVPLITRVALHRNLLDFPDNDRRRHTRAVPRLGGVAVFCGFLAALVVGLGTQRFFPNVSHATPGYLWRLVLACVILFGIGLADDLKGVRPTMKLLGQILAALIVYQNGIAITDVTFPPAFQFSLGWLSMPITVLWLVGMSNAFNLIDGLDGLASGVGVIALAAIATSGVMLGRSAVTVYAIALAGAVLGFHRYNFSPARIFLGDSGSLVVGFLLAFLSVRSATRLDGTVYALVPLFALTYPLLDTVIAMLRRWLRGDPLSRADGRHIHHQLLGLIGVRRTAKVIYAVSMGMATLGLCVTFGPPAMTIAVVALSAFALLIAIVYSLSWLDYHEFKEAAELIFTGATRARVALRDTIKARDVATLIRGANSLEEIDHVLQKSAPLFRFVSMHLGVPQVVAPQGAMWRFDYPVFFVVDDMPSRDTGPMPMLTIVCTVEPGRNGGVERIASVVAQSLADWFSERTIATHELRVRARTSAPTPAHRATYNGVMPMEAGLSAGEFGDTLRP